MQILYQNRSPIDCVSVLTITGPQVCWPELHPSFQKLSDINVREMIPKIITSTTAEHRKDKSYSIVVLRSMVKVLR